MARRELSELVQTGLVYLALTLGSGATGAFVNDRVVPKSTEAHGIVANELRHINTQLTRMLERQEVLIVKVAKLEAREEI